MCSAFIILFVVIFNLLIYFFVFRKMLLDDSVMNVKLVHLVLLKIIQKVVLNVFALVDRVFVIKQVLVGARDT